ncbi:hypothetical protein ACQRC6_06245 [Peptoniphilus sp. SGI.035]|uniref:hypothetical protein n=1 Tax=Peptoniphilus sp. SGI.035 TaxID=3420564 RepID=UPI003D07383A
MEVWLTHNGDRLRLPITPFYNIEEPQNNNTETLNEVGTINLKGKKGLKTLTIESFFPSKDYYFLESSDVILDPFYYDNKIRNWANAKEPIRLIITETPHNFEVLIDSYTSGEQDGTGDLYYSLALSEYVRIEATEYEPPVINRTIKAKDIKRFAGVVLPTMALLTVGKYDTVWSIGKKLTGNGKNGKQLLKQSGLKKPISGKVIKL